MSFAATDSRRAILAVFVLCFALQPFAIAFADINYNTANVVYQKTSLPETDTISGSLLYSYPIVTPPGRAGMEPSLKLSYDSSQNNNVNITGYGWDFNIPKIERINRRGNDAMYSASNTYFNSSLSGELATTTEANLYVARVEGGDFLKYSYDATTTSWMMYDKHGTTYTFGTTTTSRNADPNDSSHIAEWHLNEVRDANGNYISYTYAANGNNHLVYPSQITYTNSTTGGQDTTGIFQVSFVYENRSDTMNSQKWGFTITNGQRLKTVEIRTNGTLTRKYELAYGTGVNGVRSLLSGITETGYDSQSNATTLPATSFSYTGGFENGSSSDGLELYPSSGSFGSGGYYGPPRHGWIFADLNGDGYLDAFISEAPDTSEDMTFTALIQMNTFGASASGALPPLIFNYNCLEICQADYGNRVFDLNGDGFADFIGLPILLNQESCYPNCPAPVKTAYANDAANTNSLSFLASTSTAAGYPGFFNSNQPTSIGDTNGDGLPDFSTNSNIAAYIDWNGDGVEEPVYKNSPPAGNAPFDSQGNDMGVRYLDINADGLIDVLQGLQSQLDSNQNKVYINTGNDFVLHASTTAPTFLSVVHGSGSTYTYILTDYPDNNGDGLADNIENGPTTRADLLKTITQPQGGSTAVEYKPTTRYHKDDNSLANPKLPSILWTVSKMTMSDGLGGAAQIETFNYEGGKLFWNGPYDRKFSGFEKVTKTAPSAVTVNYYHQGNGNNSANGEAGDSWGKIGRAYKTEVFDTNGALFSRTQNIFGETAIAGTGSPGGFSSSTPVFVYLSKKIEESYDGGSNHKDRATEYTYDTSNGNLTGVIDDGVVTSDSSLSQATPSFSDTGSDKLTSLFEYAYATSTATSTIVRSEVDRKTATPQAGGSPIAESKIYFDNLSFGQIAKGNQTKQEALISGSTYASTTAGYTALGLVASSTDAIGNLTSFLYDSFNLYSATTTNPLGQATKYVYNYAIGKPTQVTDPNAQIYETTYDGLGRVLLEKIPDGTVSTSVGTAAARVTKTTYTYTDTANSVAVKKVENLNGSLSTETDSYLDGLGRVIQTRKQSEDSSVFAASDVVYNTDGRILKQSLPYFSSGASKTAATATTALYTNFSYDALGRTTAKTDAVGTTATAFSLWQTTITDSLSHSKIYFKDAFARLVQVDEHNATSTYSTLYEYDPLGNLTKETDALGNVRNFTYDSLSRRLTAEDLHAVGDGTFGSYAYQYDSAGNLTQSTDPNSTVTANTYDTLNRLTQTSVSSSATASIPTGTKATFTYDSCDFGIGKLCSETFVDDSLVSSPETNTATHTYNPAGQVKSETKSLHAKTFTHTYAYDMQGNPTSITTPDGNKNTLTYNAANLLDSLSLTQGTSTPATTTIAVLDYSPLGQLLTLGFGFSTTTNSYDAAHLYRLTNKKSLTFASTTLQDLTYSYDSVGNITYLIDNSQTNTKKSVAYVYDDLYRLTSATATSTASGSDYTHTYTYNPLGNLTYRSDVGTYSYAGNTGSLYANPHAVTSITPTSTTTPSSSFTYDKNGNLTLSSGTATTTYSWNYSNLLASTTTNNITERYSYDNGGQRVKVTDGSTNHTTLYPSKQYNADYDNGGNLSKQTSHSFGGDTVLATLETKNLITGNSGTCSVPPSGDFTLSSSCTITGTVLVPASLIIPSGKVLTVTATSTLLIDLKHYKLLVQHGGGVLIKKSSTVRQVKSSDTAPQLTFNFSDHLGSITISTNKSGTITELSDYYPYGNIRLDQKSGLTEQRKYIGQEFDAQTNLNYLNARYYDSARGQFLSEDPVFWEIGRTQDGKKILTNPQAQNSYSYAQDNPIVNKDPTGRIAGIDDAIGFGIGGLVGVGTQALVSFSTGNRPTFAELSGAFITGGIIGWGAINTPETLGASNAISASIITGLIGGFYGDLTKQGIDIATGKQKGGIDYHQAQVSGLVTSGANGLLQGLVPNAKIPGLSSGQGNMNAVGRMVQTKIANNTARTMSLSTAVKSAVGSQAMDTYRTIISGLVSIVQSLSSLVTSKK